MWNRQRVKDFQKLADSGDVEGMREYIQRVGGGKLPGYGAESAKFFLLPKEQVDLWKTCYKQLNVDMLDLLVSMGLDLSRAVYYFGNSPDPVLSFAAFMPVNRFDDARLFVRALLAHGLRFDDCKFNQPTDFYELVAVLGGDSAFYDELARYGMKFTCGSGDKDLDVLKGFARSVSKYQNLDIAACFLNHGLSPEWGPNNEKGQRAVKELWDYWEDNASELAVLIPKIPAGSIAPAERLLPIVAKSGSLEALRALESWEGAYSPRAVKVAREAAAEAGLDEIAAYLDMRE